MDMHNKEQTEDCIKISMQGNSDIAVVNFQSSSVCCSESISTCSTEIKKLIEEKKPKLLVFDFTGVKFFSSQVLGMLLESRTKIAGHKGKVIISSLSPQLHRVFKITSLDKIFEIYHNTQEALSAVGNNQ